VVVENALLTAEARIEPAERKNCKETTTSPLKEAGTISDWYVLIIHVSLGAHERFRTLEGARHVDFY
jgi:hypothetical protein